MGLLTDVSGRGCQGATTAHAGLLFFTNPGNPGARRDLTLRVSNDGGHYWNASTPFLIHRGPSAYSAVQVLNDEFGHVGVLYEGGTNYRLESILFAWITLMTSHECTSGHKQ